MKKLIAAALGLSLLAPPVFAAQPNVEPKTAAALGCMKLGDCTDDVHRITDISQLTDHFGNYWSYNNAEEIEELIEKLNDVGVKVYLADGKYFLTGQRGIYYTDNNSLYMNEMYGASEDSFLDTFRHEAWHAVQDCMAGTIDNSFVAVVFDDEKVPNSSKILADVRYQFFAPNAIPWEQEAIWAGGEPYMSVDGLCECANGSMWTVYEPTPKTREWLTDKGYIK